ncbi:Ig-like domain-containing protein, partial [Hyunsoonleella sp. 2307UL5-6]|uniref:Ig-like domain-containing protein n=1 Tax=Hyunsoonleella sp. 2307UL5-6 TaxID=3384768 RepID=UPI0039BCB0AD
MYSSNRTSLLTSRSFAITEYLKQLNGIFQIFFRSFTIALLFLFCFSSALVFAQETPQFPNTQVLVDGTDGQPGATYLVENVSLQVNGGTFDVDALISIVSFTGTPTVQNIDETQAALNRFEPSITYDTAEEAVEWNIQFIVANSADTNIANAVSIPLDSFSMEIIDMDAEEFTIVSIPASYELEGQTPPGTIISQVTTDPTSTLEFRSQDITDAGVSANNTRSVIRLNYENVSSINFTLGRANNDPNQTRNISIGFLGEINFGSPTTVITNAPPVVSNKSTSTNQGVPTTLLNLLVDATDPDNNIDITSVVLIDPNDPLNTGGFGDNLIISGEGTYSVNNAGEIIFTPENTFIGTTSALFNVEDLANATSNTATFTVTVPANIDAQNDDFTASPIQSGTAGSTSTVFVNDALNGTTVTSTTVDVSIVDADGSGATINGDGTIDIPSTTAPGTYA